MKNKKSGTRTRTMLLAADLAIYPIQLPNIVLELVIEPFLT